MRIVIDMESFKIVENFEVFQNVLLIDEIFLFIKPKIKQNSIAVGVACVVRISATRRI